MYSILLGICASFLDNSPSSPHLKYHVTKERIDYGICIVIFSWSLDMAMYVYVDCLSWWHWL